jgi:hypothetical protein
VNSVVDACPPGRIGPTSERRDTRQTNKTSPERSRAAAAPFRPLRSSDLVVQLIVHWRGDHPSRRRHRQHKPWRARFSASRSGRSEPTGPIRRSTVSALRCNRGHHCALRRGDVCREIQRSRLAVRGSRLPTPTPGLATASSEPPTASIVVSHLTPTPGLATASREPRAAGSPLTPAAVAAEMVSKHPWQSYWQQCSAWSRHRL